MRGLFASALLVVVACSHGDEGPQWVQVVRDGNYDIWIDTSRVGLDTIQELRRKIPVRDVWYRTDHKIPRLHGDKEFDRELVHSRVTCFAVPQFKVLAVDMSMRGGKLIARQRTKDIDQPWRTIERGTSEEIAAAAACHYAATTASK